MIDHAPVLWNGLYRWLDQTQWPREGQVGLARLRQHLGDVLQVSEPDCVVATYPLYAPLIQQLYRDHAQKPFRFITVVTDSISANTIWWRSPSDLWIVPNEATAQVLRKGGVPADKVLPLGFPVSPRFAELAHVETAPPTGNLLRRVLFIINHNRKKASRTVEELLELPDLHLTVTVGRDAELKESLAELTRKREDRITLLGWTNVMPRLLVENHLVITKAGGATTQEAIAARCPLIVNHVVPGQEEGNARLVSQFGLGAVVEKRKEIAGVVESAFAHGARRWQEWRKNLAEVAKPDAALRIAELILGQADHTDGPRKTIPLFRAADGPAAARTGSSGPSGNQPLLCDFHTHTNYSDGKLSLPELVDFYGQRRFDCVCVTDHLTDPRRLLGKLARLSNLVLSPSQLEEYFEVLEKERRRAWRKYSMILLPGIEFNKDGLTSKSSAHLLGIGLRSPIHPGLDLTETIAEIHTQGGLAVASHPHYLKGEWGKNTLYLWENQEKYAPLLDAWEIANRNNLFAPVSHKGLPFIANSDFHKPKHIYSWKTMLFCEKHPEAVLECVRRNQQVSITLYRDGARSLTDAMTEPHEAFRFDEDGPGHAEEGNQAPRAAAGS
jgi:UDP-N-acetylglucosamine:LPS N-acetylglucosamine transferase